MTRSEADALAVMIKARLPLAKLEVKEGELAGTWVVEAHNTRRGASQGFLTAEQLMQAQRR